ncbi:MAG: cupin domain-containing protein [Rectinemataceae bacterium]
MFGLHSTKGYHEIVPGIEIKTIAHGESVLMTQFSMEAGAKLPDHSHPNEQIGYLVTGCIRFHIGDSSRELGSGCSWCVPSGIAHSVDILEDSVAIEIFSPVRTDYLKFVNPPDIAR